MEPVSERQRVIARHVASAFAAERPPIVRYWDESRRSQVFVLEAERCPSPGITSLSTVGLSEFPLFLDGKEFDVRVELAGACHARFAGYAQVLATLAFCVINSHWFCAPGKIFPGVFALHEGVSSTMSDIYFAHPFPWDERLASTSLNGRQVAWLLAVPISEKEREFAVEFGSAALEQRFAEADFDLFDLNRASTV